MAARGWRVLPHTSEIGLEVTGRTWGSFYKNAALGLLDLYGLPLGSGRQVRLEESFEGETPEEVLVSWLSEIIFLVGTQRWAPGRVKVVRAGPQKLQAEVLGARAHEGRLALAREIKAVTYHGLKIEKKAGVLKARLILDV